VAEIEPNSAPDQAQDLGSLSLNVRAEVVGNIGNGPLGPADVDWFRFTLEHAASITLTTLDQQGSSPLISTLDLYSTGSGGSQLLAQDDGALRGGDAHIDQSLDAGTYLVALGGSGGSTGAYGLLLGSNQTLDLAHGLGDLSIAGQAQAPGSIGAGPSGAADVNWYSFTLDAAASVMLTTQDQPGGHPLSSVLSLYNSDPLDFNDPFDPMGNRLLDQESGTGAGLTRSLAAGTYYVAVSGARNTYFHPYLPGSGYPGNTGDYNLVVRATALSVGPGPGFLTSDPAPGAILDHSPLIIRLNFSSPLDPTISSTLSQIVQLTRVGETSPIALTFNFSSDATELQLTPAAPLQPGSYQVSIAGDSSAHTNVLIDPNGLSLGQSADFPFGQDYVGSFQIDGVEGNTTPGATADDTPATAHELGDVTGGNRVQVVGVIGDDPAYDPAQTNPFLANPASDVDLYHFHISGPGNHAFLAEVFAGRIGSPLDPGLTLFRLDPTNQQLYLAGVNDNTLNSSLATNGTLPLFNDAVLYAGLTEGDYYLAVSGSGNLPDPAQGLLPGMGGVFNPAVSHSGSGGFTTGAYVLNLLVQAESNPPWVVSADPLEGATLAAPPIHLSVQFSEPVNLEQLAYQASQLNQQNGVDGVYVLGADGRKYYPRLDSYDSATNQATFLMLDALPNGVNEFHLSGPLGLTDLAGNPLMGNDLTGDYVIRFTVNGPARGTVGVGNHLLWSDQEPNDTLNHPQILGILFPHELQAGVFIQRDFTSDPQNAPADRADYYQFEVLQSRPYFFTLTGSGLPANTKPLLFDAAGHPIPTLPQVGGHVRLVNLDPGVYTVAIGGWSAAQAETVKYQLEIVLGGSVENPTPLTSGRAPVLSIRLVNLPPPNTPASLPNTPASPVPGTSSKTLLRLDLPTSPQSGGIVAALIVKRPSDGQVVMELPPGALNVFSVGPLGGVRGPSLNEPPLPDRLVLPGSELFLSNGPVQLPIFIQTGPAADGNTPQVASGGTARTIEEVLRALEDFWQRMLDRVFENPQPESDWQETWSPFLTWPLSFPEANRVDAELAGSDGSGAAAVGLSLENTGNSSNGDWLWASALLAAGTVPVVPAQTRRRHGERGV
jgi:hypothetical protein